MGDLHFPALFREVEGLPCPTLVDEFPQGDTRLMTAESAAVYFGITAPKLERFWVATHYPKLGLEAPSPQLVTRGELEAVRDSRRVLRSAGYQSLTDAELDALLEFCRPRKLNPLANHVYPGWKRDSDGARVIEFRLTIGGMWEIARRTGEIIDHRTKHELGPDGRPISTRVIVTRRTEKGEIKRRATVFLEGCKGSSDTWDKDPWRMCEKCAEAAALRKACPELLAGVYEIDEPGFSQTCAAGRMNRRDLGLDPYRNQPWPETRQQFELALVDCKLRDELIRRGVISALHAELPQLSGPAFYREALGLVYADPDRWRAELPAAE